MLAVSRLRLVLITTELYSLCHDPVDAIIFLEWSGVGSLEELYGTPAPCVSIIAWACASYALTLGWKLAVEWTNFLGGRSVGRTISLAKCASRAISQASNAQV